jgi:predicted dienelactone hydrolase
LFQIAWSNAKRPDWKDLFLPLMAVLLLLLHIFLEGTRWQMFPAYVVVVCLFIVQLMVFVVFRKKGFPAEHSLIFKIFRFLGNHLAFLALIASLFLSNILPVFEFPKPSGPYKVGVRDIYLVDTTRGEDFTPDPNDHRELMVRVWYPANPLPGAKPMPYFHEVDRVGPVLMERLGLPSFILDYMDQVKTYSYFEAPLAEDQAAFPVLLFSHGYTNEISSEQTAMEELASHGYIVFSIGHTYETLATVFPDGRIILADSLRFWTIFQPDKPSHTPRTISFDDEVYVWVADSFFVMDKLEAFNAGADASPFEGRLDLEKLGAFGMSFGGATSTIVCVVDERCKAGANIDGSQFGREDFRANRLKVPFLFFYNESSEGMNDHVYKGVENWAYRVTVAGTTHSSYTDKVLWSPYLKYASTFTNQDFGTIDGYRITAIKNAYLLAFFDKYLKGVNAPLLDVPSNAFPEVDFQFRKP